MTKKTVAEKLNDELGLAEDIIAEFQHPEDVVVEEVEVLSSGKERGLTPRIEVDSNPTTGDLSEDYRYVRDNLYNLVERGNEALDGIISLAKEMEHPRAYEVAAGLIKSVTELQIMKGEKPSGNTTTHNNLYVGSTAELQAMLKGKDLK